MAATGGQKGRWVRGNARPTIGLMVDNLIGVCNYQLRIWRGVIDAAAELDVNLLCFAGGTLDFSPSDAYAAQRNVVYQQVNANNVDGLIMLSAAVSSHTSLEKARIILERLRSLPLVCIGSQPFPGTPYIAVDNAQGIRDAIGHLVEVHDYRRIAFIRGPEVNDEAETRYRTYMESLAAHGIRFDPDLVTTGDFFPASGADAAARLLARNGRGFQAVIAANDNMALGAMGELEARGLRVPYDVAVIGFDDIREAGAATPSLTTVGQPVYEQGKRAVAMLLARLNGDEVVEREIFPAALVVRQSCGCLPAAAAGPAAKVGMTARAAGLDAISAAMRRAGRTESVDAAGFARLAEMMVDDISAPGTGGFLSSLDAILQSSAAAGLDIRGWSETISAAFRAVLPGLQGRDRLDRAVSLWHHASILVDKAVKRAEIGAELAAEERAEVLRAISQVLITTFDVQALMDVIAAKLPQLEINRCAIALYEAGDGHTPTEWSRVVMAYDENGPTGRGEIGKSYPAEMLVPNAFLPTDQRYSLLIEPLYFRRELFGLALFGLGPPDGIIYATLRAQISSALQGAMLFQEHRRAVEELARSHEDLRQFTYVAFHDLQEPLRMVTNFLQLLQQKYKERIDTGTGRSIAEAVSGAMEMRQTIADMLDYMHGKRDKPDMPAHGMRSSEGEGNERD